MVTRLSKTRIHTDTSVALQGPVNYAAATGTDTYTADPSPAFTAYVTGAHYFISFGNANTSTTPTLNLNSLGAKTIVKEGTSALSAGDIPALHKGILMYDGTYLVLLNPKSSSPPPSIQIFTSSGTWTKPTGCKKVKVTVVGGGGGGGAAITNNGSSGGTSSFGAYCSATGGAGGATNGVAGGSGGAGSGGSINFVGGSGGAGTNNGHGTGGTGGNSIFGAGGYSTRVEGGTAGGNGGVYGGGGGGAGGSNGVSNNGAGGGAGGALILFLDVTSISSVSVTVGGGGAGGAPGHLAGGNGGAGVVIVEEFY